MVAPLTPMGQPVVEPERLIIPLRFSHQGHQPLVCLHKSRLRLIRHFHQDMEVISPDAKGDDPQPIKPVVEPHRLHKRLRPSSPNIPPSIHHPRHAVVNRRFKVLGSLESKTSQGGMESDNCVERNTFPHKRTGNTSIPPTTLSNPPIFSNSLQFVTFLSRTPRSHLTRPTLSLTDRDLYRVPAFRVTRCPSHDLNLSTLPKLTPATCEQYTRPYPKLSNKI